MQDFESMARAQAVLDYIEANPEKHNQSLWMRDDANGYPIVSPEELNVCNTTMCIAGTAAYLYETKDKISELLGYTHSDSPGGWEDTATKILGLDAMQGRKLFYCMDDEPAVEMLRAVANGDSTKFEAIWQGTPDYDVSDDFLD